MNRVAATESRRGGEPIERGKGWTLASGRADASAVKPSCDDCFFRRRNLCALALDEPCPTFRPDTPNGLVPPLQPSLLMRAGGAAAASEMPLRA